MWLGGMVDLGLRVIGLGTITNSEKLSLGSRVESKLKNLILHSFPINEVWLSKRGGSILNLRIQESMLAREMGPTWVRIPESI